MTEESAEEGHVGSKAMVEQDVLDCLDNALIGRAARVDTTLLTGNLKALTEQFERRAKITVRRINGYLHANHQRFAHISFCEAPGYGAVAIEGRYDYIVLNIGLVPTLTDFFQRMMATAGLWPAFGRQAADPSREQWPVTENLPAHILWNVLPNCAPEDPLRNTLAAVFICECFDLIVRHEFAHLILGHTAADCRSAVKDDPLAVQALELAADGHSAIWGLNTLRYWSQARNRVARPVDAGYQEFHRTPDDAMVNYLLSIFFVFRLMDETDWTSHTLPMRHHPPAPIRFHTVCIHLLEHFTNTGEVENHSRLLRLMEEIWELGEFIFAKTLNRKPKTEVKRLTLSEGSERHYNLLSDRAKTMQQSWFGLAQ
jgi:hypothetical protein